MIKIIDTSNRGHWWVRFKRVSFVALKTPSNKELTVIDTLKYSRNERAGAGYFFIDSDISSILSSQFAVSQS